MHSTTLPQVTGSQEHLKALVARALMKTLPAVPERMIRLIMRRFLGKNKYPMAQLFLEKAVISLKKILKDANPKIRKKLIENMVINEAIVGRARRLQFEKNLGFELPMILVISPTMRCPLKCYGCYSAQYSRDQDLDYTLLDKLLTEAESMGIRFFVFSGGEPFIYPGLHELFKNHNDSWFQVYTSGITLSGPDASRLAEAGNVIPCISVEGFEQETDKRRGSGHFKKVLAAFDNLRSEGVPFGFSATATRLNNDLVMSDDFVKFYEDKGAAVGWYFQYMPIGREPNFDLVPTPEQRLTRLNRILELRQKYGILLIDFWNDGPMSGGCIAGGRAYLHINHAGDVEPCVFCQISADNLYEKSLLEVLLTSRLFKAIRKRQPYNDNYLLPCMIIDNPEVLKEIIAEAKPKETCGSGALQLASAYFPKLSELAKKYQPMANEIWNRLYAESYRKVTKDNKKLAEYFKV